MSDTQSKLQSLANDLVHQIYEMARSELRAALDNAGTFAPAASAGSARTPKPAPKPSSGASKTRVRANKGQIDRDVAALAATIAKHPAGIAAEDARKALGFDKGRWNDRVGRAIEAKVIRHNGQAKRARRYFAPTKPGKKSATKKAGGKKANGATATA